MCVAFTEYLLDAQLEGQLWMQAWDDLAQRSAQKRADELDRDAAAVAAAVNQAAASDLVSPNSAASSAAAAASAASSVAGAAAPSASGPVPFYEGLFLSTLLNKLESLYENSFATNLKLTSVLAKLSYCPNPTLHYFLFNPDIRLATGASTAAVDGATGADASSSSSSDAESARLVLHVLRSVWNKGVKRAARMQNFARRKEEARHRLNQALAPTITATQTRSDEKRNQRCTWTGERTNESNACVCACSIADGCCRCCCWTLFFVFLRVFTSSGSVETMDGERFLRGMILLEEFLKE